SELLYLVDDDFRHPVTNGLAAMPDGFTPLESKPDSGALDYIQGNLFDRLAMKALAHDIPGPDNDLNEKVDFQVQRALRDPAVRLFAYGARFPQGIHDIHMNQGNVSQFRGDD